MFPLETYIPTNLGILVPSSEHVYMADRFVDPELQVIIANARGPVGDTRAYADGLAAKNLAHEYIKNGAEQLAEWDVAKIGVMYIAVSRKFRANLAIADMLIATDQEELVEGNDWEDRFWGVDPPGSTNGENNLGKILMRVRSELVLALGTDV